jgi:hypothetical protein
MAMKDSEILRKAQDRLKLEKSRTICHAILGASDEYRALVLKAWVMRMLCGRLFVNGWLEDQKVFLTMADLRKYRIQWLDQLIAICEAEGA